MTMNDWIEVADDLLKYRVKQDKEYFSSMDKMLKKYLNENRH